MSAGGGNFRLAEIGRQTVVTWWSVAAAIPGSCTRERKVVNELTTKMRGKKGIGHEDSHVGEVGTRVIQKPG